MKNQTNVLLLAHAKQRIRWGRLWRTFKVFLQFLCGGRLGLVLWRWWHWGGRLVGHAAVLLRLDLHNGGNAPLDIPGRPSNKQISAYWPKIKKMVGACLWEIFTVLYEFLCFAEIPTGGDYFSGCCLIPFSKKKQLVHCGSCSFITDKIRKALMNKRTKHPTTLKWQKFGLGVELRKN